jgi:hypothetical protein
MSDVEKWLRSKEEELINKIGLTTWKQDKVYFVDEVIAFLLEYEKRPECIKSPTGKHEYVLPPDSFDNPYCKHCYKE